MYDLKNRVALVTGASRGIGAAIALALARAVADVAINYRERPDAAERVCADIVALGSKAVAVQADVSVAADVSLGKKQQNQQNPTREHAHKSLGLAGDMFAIVQFYRNRNA